ncbi:hypothetical protein N826_25420 [Skermanella aerolata KACC 11604]|nr:hypothetical protein N826_25420 [Skermanella aerolata KACC 11604]
MILTRQETKAPDLMAATPSTSTIWPWSRSISDTARWANTAGCSTPAAWMR